MRNNKAVVYDGATGKIISASASSSRKSQDYGRVFEEDSSDLYESSGESSVTEVSEHSAREIEMVKKLDGHIWYLCKQSVIMLMSSNKWNHTNVMASSRCIFEVLHNKHKNEPCLQVYFSEKASETLHRCTQKQLELAPLVELRLKGKGVTSCGL